MSRTRRRSTRIGAAGAAADLPPIPPTSSKSKTGGNLKTGKKNKKDGDKKKKKKEKFKLAYTNRKSARIKSRLGNNELSAADLSLMPKEEQLQLESWGLPQSVVNKYHQKGVTSLFQWQLDCLANEKVLGGRNLLYSAPTSAGKTLVAEILMLKRVLELGKKAIMILPFVSVCREKMYSLQEIFGDAGIRVEGFMGAYAPPGGFKAVDIAICTIEKANSLINRLLEEKELSQLGTIIVDELHLIGDPHRGYLLELLLTKIKFMTNHRRQLNDSIVSSEMEDEAGESKKLNIQVIGMSATLPNLKLLSEWLNAELQTTDYRPVPLVERICFNNKIYNERMEPVRDVYLESLKVDLKFTNLQDKSLVYLSLETVLNGHSVLIFCPTKARCEGLAKSIAREFYNIGNPNLTDFPEIGEKLREELNTQKISEVLTQLTQCPGGLEEVLKTTVSFGVAFHHAGLTYDERDIIEASFKRSVLRVIVATSTLSAGVNLPARRVIISSPLNCMGKMLEVMTYRQMCGRAGRKGVDTEGESILMCTNGQSSIGKNLVESNLPHVRSALLGNEGALTSSMKRAILEVVASGIATLPSDVEKYAKCTLLTKSIEEGLYDNDKKGFPTSQSPKSQKNTDETIQECLKFLVDNEFIRLKTFEDSSKPDEYMTTQLGSACLASSMAPDEGITVYKELEKALQCLVLSTNLHTVYQVTPIYLSDQINNIPWDVYQDIWKDTLSPNERRVADLVGVSETFILRAQIFPSDVKKNKEQYNIHQRFYAALALNDLVNEVPISKVASKYYLNKGVIQNLQQSASTFAGMVTAFCGRLGWSNMELILSQFQERLQFGVQRELCDLVRLSTMNGQRARILYDSGIKSVAELAASDPATIEYVLHRAAPFLSSVHGHGGSETNSQRHIWVMGNGKGLSENEASQKIVEEARQFIQLELGLSEGIKFDGIKRPESGNNDLLGQIEQSSDSEEEEEEKADAIIKPPIENNNVDDNSLSDAVFDDSFPLVNSQALQLPQVNVKLDKEVVKEHDSFMDIAEIVNNIVDTSMDISDSEVFNKSKENIPNTKNTEIMHSTPRSKGLKSNIFRKQRLSSINLHEESKVSQLVKTSTPKGGREHGNNEINTELMAEFDKDFDSVASRIETSLNISAIEEAEGNNKRKNESIIKIHIVRPSTSDNNKLSDSDVAAMAALANDSTFASQQDMFADEEDEDEEDVPQVKEIEINNNNIHNNNQVVEEYAHSEDMFAEFEEEQQQQEEHGQQVPSIPSTSSAGFFNGSTTNECETSVSLFDYSSEVFNDSSIIRSGSMSARNRDNAPSPLYTAKIGNKVIKVMKILAPEFIPDFAKDGNIGLSISIAPPKKAASIAKSGIGSKVIRGGVNTLKTGSGGPRVHSIALYNGGTEIWVYQWSHVEPHDPLYRSSKKKLVSLSRRLKRSRCTLSIFDSKDKLRRLLENFGRNLILELPSEKILDPKIAQWMLLCDEEDWEISLDKIANLYLQEDERKVLSLDWSTEIKEAFISWNAMQKIIPKLKETQLWQPYIEIEMPSTIPLLFMEMNGFGLDSSELSKMKRVLQFKSAVLEIRAYQLAGKQFSLRSPSEIGKVLFKELGLKQPPGTKGTSKDVLRKIETNNDLPKIIIEHRKVTNALEKVVAPFQQEKSLETNRVHGRFSKFTVTGRVVMGDPSLQHIPRNFDLMLDFSQEDIENFTENCKIKFGTKLSSLLNQIEISKRLSSQPEYMRSGLISMRNVFVPCSDQFVLLAADYSQLELRILAHLCKDKGLLDSLNQEDGDVFVSIASNWKALPPEQITPSMRQEAKGIVYGVIYGMGLKALSEQMGVSEYDAKGFRDEFMKTYPAIRTFLESTKKSCRQNGYIETMTGRRRYLPHINSKNPEKRAQAERQAVNSQIQGSAAELVKTAMIKIQKTLSELFPKNSAPINWNRYLERAFIERSVSCSASESLTPKVSKSIVYFPVLNLHDELIFEVRKSCVEKVSQVIREQMESSLSLSVRTPVVIKTGNTWGNLDIL